MAGSVFQPSPVDRDALSIARLEKLRTALDASEFDLLMLTSPENVLYATGYDSIPARLNRAYSFAAFVTADKLVLVCPAADFAPALNDIVNEVEVITFGTFYFSGSARGAHTETKNATFEDALVQALKQFPGYRAGIEIGTLSASAIQVIADTATRVSDATGWMLNVRALKLPAELELLRRAAQLAELGIEAGITAAGRGVTDKEVANAVAATMAAGGGMPRNVTVVGGLRSALSDAQSTERPLEPRDLLRFDVGCSYYGYQSDIARTAVIGEPTKLQAQRFAALLAGLERECELARDGARASDIFSAAVAAVEKEGLAPYLRHHVGHAIGMSVYERPVIGSSDTGVLAEGSTFCLETPYYEPGWGGMMVEDTGLVTQDGFELFTRIERNLRIVPI